MEVIRDLTFDKERALYEKSDIHIINCKFDGEADGESALKESTKIVAESCYFNLRYPLWHCSGAVLKNCEMTINCRAPLWYSNDVLIDSCQLNTIKAIRECSGINIKSTRIVSEELGWRTDKITISDSYIEGQYAFFQSANMKLVNVDFKGKYSFQYIENAVIDRCNLDTKDAFWHGKNITVRNSVIKGEYLGWYCENVTFENCKIIGTQPLCYCKGLNLINCEMIDCDLSFERSEVYAELVKPILSIKNPLKGKITAPECGEIIIDSHKYKAEIIIG